MPVSVQGLGTEEVLTQAPYLSHEGTGGRVESRSTEGWLDRWENTSVKSLKEQHPGQQAQVTEAHFSTDSPILLDNPGSVIFSDPSEASDHGLKVLPMVYSCTHQAMILRPSWYYPFLSSIGLVPQTSALPSFP